MPVSVTMPRLGESVSEGTVTRWLKQEGEHVEADEPLLEVSTDKVDTEIPAPSSGRAHVDQGRGGRDRRRRRRARGHLRAVRGRHSGAECTGRARPQHEAPAAQTPAAEAEPTAQQEAPVASAPPARRLRARPHSRRRHPPPRRPARRSFAARTRTCGQ